jgi:peptidoglycan/xylan/chitin deacetylase (PgdA/CDA1 family)
MIRTLKRSSLTLSRNLGVSSVVAASAWRRSRLLILCYHGVALDDEHRWNAQLYVSPEHLQRRLELIRRNRCTVLPLGEAVERLYRNDLPDRAVALTFDDGYYDFMARAWPVLNAYGYPATVYLTTARVEHNMPIVNLLVPYALWKARNRVLNGTGVVGLDGEYALGLPEERQRIVEVLTREMQGEGMTAEVKDAITRDLMTRLGLDYRDVLTNRVLTLLRPEEVTQLSRDGVDFQLHTHLHRTPEDATAFVDDVLFNAERIQSMTGTRPRHLCYPSGLYRQGYLEPLRRAGILSATTCDPDIAGRANDPLLLPRFIDTMTVSEVEFEGWLTGVSAWLPRRTRLAHPELQ